MADVSTKPYFIRAIYEWCSDCGYTPYLSVRVDDRTRIPMEYVKNGEIVLNVSLNATRNLTINNDLIQIAPIFVKQKYMLGEEFSMLDVAIAPLLWRLDHYQVSLNKQSAPLLKYAERLFSRQAFIDSMTASEKAMRR